MTYRKKLIEVALPLEVINVASAREKSIRHGHPSTLHLWWSRKPLATCRAVLFASLVDDPSSRPDEFPTEEDQERERMRLFGIIEELVKWENVNNEAVLAKARKEILKSTNGNPPPVLDPFAGGGSIPLEAQRLGLEAHASDLNPVAVLINKALIEIPPKFEGQPPVNPEARNKPTYSGAWKGAQGLAEDVRYYGKWIRDEAEKRIGYLYPKVQLPNEYGDSEATVIAWLYCRAVRCPNPVCGAKMPLASKLSLSVKKGKEIWAEPIVDRLSKTIRFEVRTGVGAIPAPPKVGRGAQFRCLVCGQIADEKYIKAEGMSRRMGSQMMAIVADSQHGRIYLSPTLHHEAAAQTQFDSNIPMQPLANDPRNIWCVNYGLDTFDKLFTSRQTAALTTLTNLVGEVHERVINDAKVMGLLHEVAVAKADAIATYLALSVSRSANTICTLAIWSQTRDQSVNVFSRQALPMTWDFPEVNPFAGAAGDFGETSASMAKSLANVPANRSAYASQKNANEILELVQKPIISTDPPYYDNISYADLSDFFYVWLRQSLGSIYPQLCGTLLTPKGSELVASPHRFNGSKRQAQDFFEKGLEQAFERVRQSANPAYPITVYYGFKQAEAEISENGASGKILVTASTGWETMLEGLLRAGFEINGTWPVRSERPTGVKATVNALASSIVLVCRPRPQNASVATRREFIAALRRELPDALRMLQHGNIAPVDLAQAAIGPGMAVFSRYTKVVESDGTPMRVRTALQLINQALDEVLTEQEGEYDNDTRWAIAWFDSYGTNEGLYGTAETLSKAKNTSLSGLVESGVLQAKGGKVKLLSRNQLSEDWNPMQDKRTSAWEITQHLIRALEKEGEYGAAGILVQLGAEAEMARDLAYRLYTTCERKGWAQEALAYNSLVVAWPSIVAQKAAQAGVAGQTRFEM